MTTAVLAIIILFFVIVMSASQRVNIGLLSLAMAWVLGYFIAGMNPVEVIAGFPVSLLIVLVAVTYFFGIASHNGTLEKITHILVRLVKGQTILLPIIFFLLAMVLSTLGAGNMGAVALLSPIAMIIAERTSLGAFFMTIMVICGANAGTFSPVALTGVIANGLVGKIGLPMDPWTEIYLPAFLMQTFLAVVNYVIFFFILKKKFHHSKKSAEIVLPTVEAFNSKQVLSLFAIVILIGGVSFYKIDVGFMALSLGILLTVFGCANGEEEMKSVPWGIVIMVCGVSTLVSVVEKAGGMDILITWLAQISTPRNATAILAFVTGVLSSFSSSSAVVLPTFIPLVPGLIEKMGGGNPVALVSAINIGAHIVDVSPLSTLGALCLANAGKSEDKVKLFRILLMYGLAMSFVGALASYILFGLW